MRIILKGLLLIISCLSLVTLAKENGSSEVDEYLVFDPLEANEITLTDKKIIKGKDNRVLVKDTEYPWIGQLHHATENLAQCSASLISPAMLLTAGHCVKAAGDSFFYTPNGKTRSYAGIVIIFEYDPKKKKYGKKPKSKDWAVVMLEEPIFLDSYPELVTSESELKGEGSKVSSIGYPIDLNSGDRLFIHKGCKTTSSKAKKNMIGSKCDITPGMSGGPVIIEGTNKIVGVNSYWRPGLGPIKNDGTFFVIDSVKSKIDDLVKFDLSRYGEYEANK